MPPTHFEEENRKAMAYIKDIAQQLAMPLGQ